MDSRNAVKQTLLEFQVLQIALLEPVVSLVYPFPLPEIDADAELARDVQDYASTA
jgi:hypothetical protein